MSLSQHEKQADSTKRSSILRRKEEGDLSFGTLCLGFGIRVYSTGRKVWFVISRVKGRQRSFTIGTYPVLDLGDVRSKARQILRDVQMGRYDEDPPLLAPTTFNETIALFVSLCAKLKTRAGVKLSGYLASSPHFTIDLSVRSFGSKADM
jgi:Arm DNA-binding domain